MSGATHLGRPDRRLRTHPWFWGVLVLKLAASASFGSHFVRDLFVPFITWFVNHHFANPWDAFARTGPTDAFPYSGVMLVVLATPQAVATWVAPGLVASSEPLRLLLIRLPMLGADLIILAILRAWFPARRGRVLWIYWCSPILFFISYVHGQVDSIPTALLFISLYALFRGRPGAAGVAIGLGIAAKMHLLVALPFLALHLWTTRVGRARVLELVRFLAAAAITSGAIIAPFLRDPGYRLMVLGTRETDRLFEIALPIAGQLKLYAAPVAVFVVLIRYASTQWSSRDILLAFLALAFGVLLLFAPPMPGWYYWALPLIACFFIQQEGVGETSFILLNLFYVTYYLFFWNVTTEQLPPSLRTLFEGLLLRAGRLESVAFTALQGSLVVVLFWVYRVGLHGNPALRARRTPVLIGIAGDSGSGKHTLSQLLRSVLGPAAVETNGDDYHRWPRGHAAWRGMTQLNPQGNRLSLAVKHAERLRGGHTVRKAFYDHDKGGFTDEMLVPPRRFVLFVGLHTLAVRRMRSTLDLMIYLDTDEELRQTWKASRDQATRGYTRDQVLQQIRDRESDVKQYVRPQLGQADWVVRHERDPATALVRTRHLLWNDVPLDLLIEALSADTGIRVQWRFESDFERQSLEIAGPLAASTVREIAERLFPRALAQLDSVALAWKADQDGVTQLVFLALLNELAGDDRMSEV